MKIFSIFNQVHTGVDLSVYVAKSISDLTSKPIEEIKAKNGASKSYKSGGDFIDEYEIVEGELFRIFE